MKTKTIKNKAGVPNDYWDSLSDYDKRAINATKGLTIAADKLAQSIQAISQNDAKALSLGWVEAHEIAIRKINALTRMEGK